VGGEESKCELTKYQHTSIEWHFTWRMTANCELWALSLVDIERGGWILARIVRQERGV